MTNYPPPSSLPPAPPYQPSGAPPGYGPPPGWGSPAQAASMRAAVMMWVLGALGLLFGFCMTTVAFVFPTDMLVNQARHSLPQAQLSQISDTELAHAFKIFYLVLGVVLLVGSIVLLVLGMYVRRGGRRSIITGLVVFIGLGLFAVLSVLSEAAQAVMVSPVMLLGVLLWLVLGGAFGLTILWLFQALRTGATAQQMHAYYAQLQQQSFQAHSGYGYGYQVPNQSAAPPPQQSLGTVPPPDGSRDPGAAQ